MRFTKSMLLSGVAFTAGLGMLGVSNANALPFIDGGVSFSDGGLTLPALPSTSIVSALTTITQGAPTLTNCTTNFAGCVSPGTAATFTSAAGVNVYSFVAGGDTFTFHLTTAAFAPGAFSSTPAGTSFLNTDSLQVLMAGSVTDSLGNYASTGFAGIWTAQGTCTSTSATSCTNNETASWSASLTALDSLPPPPPPPPPTTVPEPASLTLLGAGLVGLGAVTRRRRNKS